MCAARGLCWMLGLIGSMACAPAVQHVPVQVQPSPTVRVHVQLHCEGPCRAIEHSCQTGCDHMGYDPTPGRDQQHCRDECSDNESDCVRDCEGG